MTLDELRERIKNELVLHEGNVADWQWNRTGLPAEATELGVADFLRLVDDVSRPLNAQFGKILDLQSYIKTWTSESDITSERKADVLSKADRLGLSHKFILEKWFPKLLLNNSTIGVKNQYDISSDSINEEIVAEEESKNSENNEVQVIKNRIHLIIKQYEAELSIFIKQSLLQAIGYEEAHLDTPQHIQANAEAKLLECLLVKSSEKKYNESLITTKFKGSYSEIKAEICSRLKIYKDFISCVELEKLIDCFDLKKEDVALIIIVQLRKNLFLSVKPEKGRGYYNKLLSTDWWNKEAKDEHKNLEKQRVLGMLSLWEGRIKGEMIRDIIQQSGVEKKIATELIYDYLKSQFFVPEKVKGRNIYDMLIMTDWVYSDSYRLKSKSEGK